MLKRLLGISVILLLLVACSESNTEQPDIEATVQGSVQESLTTTPTSQISTQYKLKSPWDTRIFNNDAALSRGQCPNPMGLPTQIPDRLENGEVDQKAWDELSNILDIVILSDLAVSKGNKAAAGCVLDNLYYWAQNDAFVINKECDPSHKQLEMTSGHGYDRANFINGILAIPYLQIRNAPTLDESKKTTVLSWF